MTAMPSSPSELDLYRFMLLSRLLDERLCALRPTWFPCAGEEATIIGAFADLLPGDVAAVHYRDPFAAYVMRGAELWRLVAQVMGRRDGYSGGRSVPFTGPVEHNIVPWVAGDLGTSVGVATGAALALLQRGDGNVCVCSFGDGTANRGDVHEAINLAAVWKLPIVYVCQHNGWAISQPADSYLLASVADRATGYGIPGVSVDGCDLRAVRTAVDTAVARARTGKGPTLLEARTWRMRGHWAADKMTYRTDEKSVQRDPITCFIEQLRADGVLTAENDAAIAASVARELDEAFARAEQSPVVTVDDVGLHAVYAP